MSTNLPATVADLLARLGISEADVAHRSQYSEATHLVSVGLDCFGREASMAPAAAGAWTQMRDAAHADDVALLLVSAFRSYEYQSGLFERKLVQGMRVSDILAILAPPGFSQHHTGRAIDIGTTGFTDLTENFETMRAFGWLVRNAADFGFLLSYPRNNPDGTVYEPWHWFFP